MLIKYVNQGSHMRYSVITFAHNKAHQILEWVSHYKTLGISDLAVISYPSDDDTRTMLSILHDHGHITHILQDAYSDASATPQQAIATASKTLGLTETDWVLCVDMDDFLAIDLDGGTLPDLTSQIPDGTGLCLSRRYFGNNGLVDPSQKLVFQTHLRGAPTILNQPIPNRQPAHLHRLSDPTPAEWLDGSGRALKFPQRARVLNADRFAWAQLNSYPLRSVCDFLIDLAANAPKSQHILDPLAFWIDHNFNFETIEPDKYKTKQIRYLLHHLRSLPMMQDCEINSRQWRQNILPQIMQDEHITNLAQHLMMLLPSQPLTGFHVQLIRRLKTL